MRPIVSRPILLAIVLSTAAACGDQPAAPKAEARSSSDRIFALGAFNRYVAIGTSVSMGWRSDGVVAAPQRDAWPVQLATMAGRQLDFPAIADPGCGAPIAAPLAGGRRTSGEAIAAPADSRVCAPNAEGVVLPAGNVAINAATAALALHATPETITGSNARLYARVLAPGQTQVTAMLARDPKLVTVELGGNELLDARSGVFLPGRTVVPFESFARDYAEILDSVQRVAKYVAVVGLIDHAASFPSFRTGNEVWEARATFAPLNVTVSADCENSPNLIFVAVRIPAAAAEGAARGASGPATFSCVNYPSSTGIQDYVLGPDDVAALDAQLAQMDAFIAAEAERRGFAHFRLAALYEDALVKPPLNAVALMTTATPYGPLVSLDGFHPTGAGARVLAIAAAVALNDRYHMGIDVGSALLASMR